MAALSEHAARLQALCNASPVTKGMRVVVARGGLDLLRDEPDSSGQMVEYRCGRMTPCAADEFGLSIVRHTGRLEKVPFFGTVDMVHEAMEGPLAHVFEGF